jgi:UDP-N-acetylglucosamine 1-carboxyvinyltransferase
VTDTSVFVVRPSGPLFGSVNIKGAKNSVLKLMAATLLAEGTHHLHNVPDITDVKIVAELLRRCGVSVSFAGEGHVIIEVPATERIVPRASLELVSKIRASVVVMGPLLARCNWVELAQPGGDDFGSRPIDYHIEGFSALGATFSERDGYLFGRTEGLTGSRVVLEFPSHTATDNILMAAVLAEGRTVIENAAREPEVIDLASMLISMGADIRGAGTSRIEVQGVPKLSPADHWVIPDRVEAASFLAAVAVAGGEVFLRGAREDHMEMLLRKVASVGVHIETTPQGILAKSEGKLKAVDVSTLPYPGVATDYQPLVVTMLSVADGTSVVSENLFSGRFRYVEELRKMGADIFTDGHHVVIRGTPRLKGARVQASDIRAGVALVVAALVADGETEISGVRHIDRGYERIEERLRALGADIERRSAQDLTGCADVG